MKFRNKKFYLVLIAVIIGFVAGLIVSVKMDLMPGSHAEGISVINEAVDETAKTAETKERASVCELEKAMIKVAEETGKAVVSVSTVRTEKVGCPFEFFGNEDMFKRFFGDYFGEMPQKEFKQEGMGSGVIIDKEGYVLTNEHVVTAAEEITVKLPDGREFKAEVKGADPLNDVAILKISAENLPVAELGSSDNLKIGQIVLAIGNPFGVYLQTSEPTITMGVISALHRHLPQTRNNQRFYGDLIQTDAAINPGNSGGPLVDLNGKVIGINAAIFSSTGGYQGIGFAIPIDTAKSVMGKLSEGKKILYGWLGVNIQDITDDLKEYFKLADKNGVLIAKVLPDSPAEKSGLKEGDVIKTLDGKEIKDARELFMNVGNAEVGKEVKVDIIREGQPIIVTVKIGERPEEMSHASKKEASSVISNWRGIEVRNITNEIVAHYGVLEGKGVIVSSIISSSIAAQSGLEIGDIIYSIGKQEINSTEDFDKVTNALKGNVLVQTQKGYLVLKEE